MFSVKALKRRILPCLILAPGVAATFIISGLAAALLHSLLPHGLAAESLHSLLPHGLPPFGSVSPYFSL